MNSQPARDRGRLHRQHYEQSSVKASVANTVDEADRSQGDMVSAAHCPRQDSSRHYHIGNNSYMTFDSCTYQADIENTDSCSNEAHNCPQVQEDAQAM